MLILYQKTAFYTDINHKKWSCGPPERTARSSSAAATIPNAATCARWRRDGDVQKFVPAFVSLLREAMQLRGRGLEDGDYYDETERNVRTRRPTEDAQMPRSVKTAIAVLTDRVRDVRNQNMI